MTLLDASGKGGLWGHAVERLTLVCCAAGESGVCGTHVSGELFVGMVCCRHGTSARGTREQQQQQ